MWIAEAVMAHALARSMRGWVRRQLALAERSAAGLAVLAAVRLLPASPENPRRNARPPSAPCGFAHVPIDRKDMRGILRTLFPRERDLVARAKRLVCTLRSLGSHARRMARRIERILPAMRLSAVRPPDMGSAPRAPELAPCTPDTS